MTARSVPARVLVCGDSPDHARALAGALAEGDELQVVATCGSGAEAIQAVRQLRPELVVMSLELPQTRGLRAIEEIMRLHPVPVVVVSAQAGRESECARAVLAAGAVEALPESQLRVDEPMGAGTIALRHRLRRLARANHARVSPPAETAPPARLARPAHRATAVGICASTGGPGALATVLAELPASFPLPVLVAQHMADGFIDALVRWLDERTRLPVAVVRAEMPLEPGVWFAPDNGHLTLRRTMRLAVEVEADIHRLAPSADMLLTSMADALGARAIGVVLTGMGRDGGAGVAAICRAGGHVIAQDEDSSVVFGMPRTAIEQGAAEVLPLEHIAGALRRLTFEEVHA